MSETIDYAIKFEVSENSTQESLLLDHLEYLQRKLGSDFVSIKMEKRFQSGPMDSRRLRLRVGCLATKPIPDPLPGVEASPEQLGDVRPAGKKNSRRAEK